MVVAVAVLVSPKRVTHRLTPLVGGNLIAMAMQCSFLKGLSC